MNLLQTTVPAGGKIVDLPKAALFGLIGFLVVLMGIAFLIFIVWLVGKLLGSVEKNDKSASVVKEKKPEVPTPQPIVQSDDVDEETVAVIMAALTAYYENNYPKCEFTVKRIKRIRRNDYA